MRFFLHFRADVLDLLTSKFAGIVWFIPSQCELSRLQIVEILSELAVYKMETTFMEH